MKQLQLLAPCRTPLRSTTFGRPKRIGERWQYKSAEQTASQLATLVKICGVTNPEDAEVAAKAGADFIGMIMWPKAKRSVAPDTAARVVSTAHEYGAKAVGVYVDEDAETIGRTSSAAGLDIVQLHGSPSRDSLLHLSSTVRVIYVMQATEAGSVVTPAPAELAKAQGVSLERSVDWVLMDGMQGGAGRVLDWSRLSPPVGLSTEGWLLAGGLHPDNVAEAVSIVHPTGVDVSSGVCGPDGLKKDHGRVLAFIQAAKSASGAPT